MSEFLVVYLLVFASSFSPMEFGFGIGDYWTFRDLDDVAIKIYLVTKHERLRKNNRCFKLYKITLSAKDTDKTKDGSLFHEITTEHFKKIEEIPLPMYEIK